jgi:hypothetical protein
MALNTLLRTSTVLYEEKHMQENEQLFKFLFRTEDTDLSASFLLDEFIQDDYAVAYRDENNQAHIRPYQAGSGTLYTPPRASEKTPIDETLRDVTPEGVEATSGFNVAQMRKTDKILSIHQTAHNMTKNKQALDVLRTGVFYAKGITANDIGKDENYARDIANTLTYDFTAGGATVDEALTEINAQLDAQSCPKDNRAVIVGQSWLTKIQSDTNVLTKMQANTANVLVRQTINPMRQYDGLFWVGEYLPAGSVSSLQIYSYSPDIEYKPYKGAAAEAWMPATEIVGFSTSSKTYRIYRGMDVKGAGDAINRVTGEMVFDSFVSDEPVAENLRSNTRHIFLYGNINHTVVSTGTFA